MIEQAHSTLGASSAHRWMECPGSVRLYQLVPETQGEPSIHAAEGTKAHELAADCLNHGIHPVGDDLEMVKAVDVYYNYVNSLEGDVRLVEERVDLSRLKPAPPVPMFGTADAIVWNKKQRRLHVVDFKYGKGVKVEVKDNPQLLYYALGAVLALRVRPETIRVAVVQPRADHRDGPIREHVYDWQELTDFKNKLLEAAALTAQPDAPVGPVGSHCRWCRAKPVCPAQERNLAEATQTDLDHFNPPPPDVLSVERLAYLLTLKPFVDQWFTESRNYVEAQLEQRQEVPGWKLVAKRAARKWEDEHKAAEFLQSRGISEREVFETKVISPAKAEKLLTDEDKEVLRNLVIKQSSGTTLVPDTDPRPSALPVITPHTFLENN